MKSKLLALVLAVITVFSLVVGFSTDGVAFATVYGNKDTTDENAFWYYGENHLDVDGLKAEISSWDLSKADKNNPVVIALVDTGVNANHNVFTVADTLYKKDGAVAGYNAYNAVKNDEPTAQQLANIVDDSSDGHGTAIASVMAMLIKELGLEEYIKIYPIKASQSGKSSFEVEVVNKALDYVIADESVGFDVVNLAMCSYDKTAWIKYQSKYSELSSKCVVVAAAGNGNYDDKKNPQGFNSADKPGYPAAFNGVLSVMAYDGDGNKRESSNYGAYDVIAPGEDIVVAKGTDKSYQTSSGTSSASAFVSVVSAVLKLRSNIRGEDVNANVIASHIRKSYSTYVEYDGVKMKKFNAVKCVKDDYSSVYVEPNGLVIAEDGVFGDDVVDLYKNRNTYVKLTATLLPYGDTNPDADAKIVWTLTEILSRPIEDEDLGEDEEPEVEEYEGVPVIIGEGGILNYKPEKAGKYIVKATYTDGENVFSDYRTFALHYTSYDSIAGDVEVALVEEADSDNPSKNAKIYLDETKTFTLTYLDCVDDTVEVKWYVNGEYRASGKIFEFAPDDAGTYVITARYGDYRAVEKSFTLTVKSAVLHPAYLAGITVSAVVVVALIVIAFVQLRKASKRTPDDSQDD